MFISGYSQQNIQNILCVSDQSGMSKFLKCYKSRGTSENKQRSVNPRKTYVRGDRKILRCVKLNWQRTLAEITGGINERLPSTITSGGVYDFLILQEREQGRHCQFALEITLNV